MADKTKKKGSLENLELRREIPPSAGLLEKIAIEAAEILIAQTDKKITHGCIVEAIQSALEQNSVDKSKWLDYFEMTESHVKDLALNPDKLTAAKSRPQHQQNLPETMPGEKLKFGPAPDGELKIYYQDHVYFAKLTEHEGEKKVVIRYGKDSVSLTQDQSNHLRHEAHKRFAQIEKRKRKKDDPRQNKLY